MNLRLQNSVLKMIPVIIFVMFFIAEKNVSAFNNRFNLIGSREAAMGGTGVASGLGVSNIYYNPAAISFIDSDAVFSTSANLLNITKFKRQFSFSTPYPTIQDTLQLDTATITNGMIGLVIKLSDRFVFGLALIHTDQFNFSTQANRGAFSIKALTQKETFLFGPSLAFKISNNFALGISVFIQRSKHDFDLILKHSFYFSQIKSNIKNWSIIPVVGLCWRPFYNIKLGLTYQIESSYLTGTNDYFYNEINSSIATSETNSGTTKGQTKYPHRLAFGVAYEEPKAFTIAADVIFYFPMSYHAAHEFYFISKADYYHTEKAHFDFSLGMEVYISESFIFRFGAFTNSTGAPDSLGSEKINLYGGSIGIGFGDQQGLSADIGIVMQYGRSNEGNYNNNKSIRASWEGFICNFIVGGTYRFGSK